jgi:hypothetical protein
MVESASSNSAVLLSCSQVIVLQDKIIWYRRDLQSEELIYELSAAQGAHSLNPESIPTHHTCQKL